MAGWSGGAASRLTGACCLKEPAPKRPGAVNTAARSIRPAELGPSKPQRTIVGHRRSNRAADSQEMNVRA